MILSKFKPSKAIQKAKTSKAFSCSAGYLTVINSKNNGRRIEIRKEVADKLKLEDAISVAYDSESVVLYKPLDDIESVSFNVRKQSSKSVVYSYGLVTELTEFFELDFSDRVSYTFAEGAFEVDEESGHQILVIKKKINKEASETDESLSEADEVVSEVNEGLSETNELSSDVDVNETIEIINTESEEVTYEE